MQTGLACLEIVASINRLNIDLRSIVREQGINSADVSVPELLRIGKQLGFKAKLKRLPWAKYTAGYPLPAILVLKSNAFAVLLKIDPEKERALVFIPGENSAKDLPFAELDDIATGDCIVLTHKLISSQIKFWIFSRRPSCLRFHTTRSRSWPTMFHGET